MHVYVTLGATDHAASIRFYDAVLATIGWSSDKTHSGQVAYSAGGHGLSFVLWVLTPRDGRSATAGNGVTVGLPARSRAQVDAFHAAALAWGGSDAGAPGIRSDYGPHWYGAYVRDPSGNKLAAVCRDEHP